MTMLEQLDNEINQKVNALNESIKAQKLLREALENSIKTLGMVEKRLLGIEAYLTYSNTTINKLKLENRSLKSSCDEWIKRAINLEFKVLSAGYLTKK
jgi:transketolase